MSTSEHKAARPLDILITGYGPFGDVRDNPSDQLGREVASRPLEGVHLTYRRLDVQHAVVDSFIAELRACPPDIVLALGFTRGQAQLEACAENRVGGGREGETQPAGPITPHGPATCVTWLPPDVVEAALASLPERSIATPLGQPGYLPDRSGYLCNYLNYQLCCLTEAAAADTRLPRLAGFVHVSRETTAEEIDAIVRALAAHASVSPVATRVPELSG